jgi:hypothetical protein
MQINNLHPYGQHRVLDISNKKRGFVALISVIIISAILLLVATSLSFSGFFGRFNILESEFKERSSALADACVDSVLLSLAQNPSYNPTLPLTVPVSGNDNCTVVYIATPGSTKVIKTKGTYQQAITNLQVVVNTSDLTVVSWEEIPYIP